MSTPDFAPALLVVEDDRALSALLAELFTDEGYPAGPSDIAARLARFGPPDAAVVVAEHEGALLGFIAVHALPRFEHGDSQPAPGCSR